MCNGHTGIARDYDGWIVSGRGRQYVCECQLNHILFSGANNEKIVKAFPVKRSALSGQDMMVGGGLFFFRFGLLV